MEMGELIKELAYAKLQAMQENDNPDDTLFAQLTLKEVSLITYSLIITGMTDSDLVRPCKDLTSKLADLIEEQKENG